MNSHISPPAGGRRETGTAFTRRNLRGPVAPLAAVAGWFFFALLAVAQEPKAPPDRIVTPMRSVAPAGGPAELRLTGPSTGTVGSPVVIVVSGLPSVDLAATIGTQTAWVESIRFDVSTPAGAEVELEKELSMSVSPWAWRLRLTITPPAAGTYLVVCDWNQEPYGLAMHRVEVAGSDPTPPGPGPGPRPPPVLPPNQTTATALILLETSDSNQAHELLRQAIRRDAALSPRVMILDPDSKTESDQPDPIVQAALAHLANPPSPNRPLPRVLGQGPDGGFLWDAELPATIDALRALLTERGMR